MITLISKKRLIITLSIFLSIFLSCQTPNKNTESTDKEVFIKILGTIQDGGMPHLGCSKKCCKDYYSQGFSKKRVVSIGISNIKHNKHYLIEASPDINHQLKDLLKDNNLSKSLDGIFITHAHMGHYSGLLNLGRESFNSVSVPLFVMPKMHEFISLNGPWDQLVKLKNVDLKNISNNREEILEDNLSIVPFLVPHRDEYSETVGYKIIGPSKTALFIPDIDKWEKWKTSIVELVKEVDYAFLDGTFYDAKEINNRDISEIPHPFIIESLELFKDLSLVDKNKVYFIHLNHTNPAIDKSSDPFKNIISKGFNVADINMEFSL
ncbi:MAG: MBL fold metallo-hydrolase [Flavobacteriales bacterium]|jgi:pyrroloquinoline quinone biosynthesis protein B|tara:strand:+ start:3033 stop:3998 length:966 start_codon:yes stop_codon:yes gene_type:complete